MPKILRRWLHRFHPHRRGRGAEQLVQFLYLLRGYRRVRFHGKHPPRLPAQIDLLCRRGTTLVLVEVKYRADDHRRPFALHRAQQQRLRRAAGFLAARLPWATTLRADLVLVGPVWPYVRRLTDAFPLTPERRR